MFAGTERGASTTRRVVALSVAAVTAGGLGVTAVAATAGAAASTVVKVATNRTWGRILTLGNGDTLYRPTADKTNKSVCSGKCATVWPPALLAAGQKSPVALGIKGLGALKRSNGSLQITYQGIPLYLFEGDHAAGQATGNVKDSWGQWWVVNPNNPHATPTAKRSTGSASGGSSSSSGSGSSSSSSGSGSNPSTTVGAGGGGVAY